MCTLNAIFYLHCQRDNKKISVLIRINEFVDIGIKKRGGGEKGSNTHAGEGGRKMCNKKQNWIYFVKTLVIRDYPVRWKRRWCGERQHALTTPNVDLIHVVNNNFNLITLTVILQKLDFWFDFFARKKKKIKIVWPPGIFWKAFEVGKKITQRLRTVFNECLYTLRILLVNDNL